MFWVCRCTYITSILIISLLALIRNWVIQDRIKYVDRDFSQLIKCIGVNKTIYIHYGMVDDYKLLINKLTRTNMRTNN